jgi:hypothetical protein
MDSGNHAIRKINVATGWVSTIAGTGSVGSNNGKGEVSTFSHPEALAIGLDGALYIGDTGNNQIRKIMEVKAVGYALTSFLLSKLVLIK